MYEDNDTGASPPHPTAPEPTTPEPGSGAAAGGSPISAWLHEAWSQPAEVRAVEVEGAMVSYRGWGLDQVDKPGLLLAHGMVAHARWWDHIGPRFRDRYRVVAIDFSGMGDSGRRSVYSRQLYARELTAVARHAGLRDVVIVAHSFGATPGLFALMSEPELVRRTIVLDARVFQREATSELPVQRERSYASREEAIARYRLIPASDGLDPEVRAYVAEHSVRLEEDGRWRWKFDPLTLIPPDRAGMIEEIQFRTMAVDYVNGGASTFTNPEFIAKFRHHMPGCSTPVEVPLANHHMMLEQPVAFVAAINGILANPHPHESTRPPTRG